MNNTKTYIFSKVDFSSHFFNVFLVTTVYMHCMQNSINLCKYKGNMVGKKRYTIVMSETSKIVQ